MPKGLTVIDAPNREARRSAALDAVRRAQACGRRVAWIVSTADMALALKRELADAGTPLAGVEIATPEAWVSGRWTLWGDGRKAITGLQRLLYVKKALLQTPSTCPSIQSRGMLTCLRDVVRSGAGLAPFEDASCELAGLSKAQGELMDAARLYFQLIQGEGLLETGTAAGLLARDMPDAGWPHLVVEGAWNLHDVYVELLGAACAHGGVTYVGCLGDNGAFACERRAAELLARQAEARGVQVARVEAGAPGEGCPRSAELASLTDALFAAQRQPAVQATGALRACLPAGRYAQVVLLAKQIAQLVDEDGIAARDIVVAASDPQKLASQLVGPLSEHAPRGIAVACAAPSRLAGSDAGRFVLDWLRLLEEAWLAPERPAPELCAMASDLARNPLMRLSQSCALRLDREWRGWRLTTTSDFVNDLVDALTQVELQRQAEKAGAELGEGEQDGLAAGAVSTSPHAPSELELNSAPVLPEGPRDLSWVLRLAQERLPHGFTPQAIFERASWEGISTLAEHHAAILGRDPKSDELADLLDTVAVDDGWTGVPTSDIAAQRQARALQASPNAVRVVALRDLDAIRARAVVLCDLTAEAYPLRERVDAKTSLWDALGLVGGPSQVDSLRRSFRAGLECVGDVVVVQRLLANEDAEATRPCALLEELIDCYRDDPTDLDSLDKATGLPRSGCIPSMGMGEEQFARLASPVTYAPAGVECDAAAFELDDPELRELLSSPDAVWSPSGLESLINCPMRWLHERRLPTRALDMPFDDPIAQGSFCHLVLERFHTLLGQRTGTMRIMPGMPRDEWVGVLDQAWDEAVEQQQSQERPFVAITETEVHKLRGVRRRLEESLECEQYLPAGFIPQGNEYSFGDDEPVMLGGVRLHGTIDRIDVNEQSNSVLVVDYKGGLSAGHRPVRPDKDDDASQVDCLPRHSQILMYLAAARQLMPGKELAGGLYVSYSKPECAGFLDPAQVGMLSDEKGAYLNRRACEVPPAYDGSSGLDAVLARVEEAATEAVSEVAQGRVVARPRFGKDSCMYCPLEGTCPKKEG